VSSRTKAAGTYSLIDICCIKKYLIGSNSILASLSSKNDVSKRKTKAFAEGVNVQLTTILRLDIAFMDPDTMTRVIQI
jgi:hypothetical protein